MSDAHSHVRCFGRAVLQMRELRHMSRQQLAKKSKIKLAVLTAIEEGTISGGDFGVEEIGKLSEGMGITRYRLMMAYEAKCKEFGEGF